MAAGEFHAFEVEQGSTLRMHLTWYQPGPLDPETLAPQLDEYGRTVKGPPHDLTGCSAQMQFRAKPGSALLMEATTDNGGIVLGGTDGTLDIHFTDEQTLALTGRNAQYDLYVEFPSGERYRLMEGKVPVDATVTRITEPTP